MLWRFDAWNLSLCIASEFIYWRRVRDRKLPCKIRGVSSFFFHLLIMLAIAIPSVAKVLMTVSSCSQVVTWIRGSFQRPAMQAPTQPNRV